jgi:pseudouridine synthase
MEQRLQKVLAAAGVASRREAEKLILAGRVAVNGIVITQLGTKVDPEAATIVVDGKRIEVHPEQVYLLLNKPRGYTSTRRDPHAPRVITDLVKGISTPLYPVGRLDVDTEGMIILTNDGDFAFIMTHPKHNVSKTYRAEVAGLVTQGVIQELSTGILLDDRMTSPAKVSLVALNTARQTSIIDIVITEGRKRQVRRMFGTVGHPVVRLVRMKIGPITLGELKPGEWRFLTAEEVSGLLASAS